MYNVPCELVGAQVRPRQEILSHSKMDEISIPEESISDNMPFILWELFYFSIIYKTCLNWCVSLRGTPPISFNTSTFFS